MQEKVLIVDDEREIVDIIILYLENELTNFMVSLPLINS